MTTNISSTGNQAYGARAAKATKATHKVKTRVGEVVGGWAEESREAPHKSNVMTSRSLGRAERQGAGQRLHAEWGWAGWKLTARLPPVLPVVQDTSSQALLLVSLGASLAAS